MVKRFGTNYGGFYYPEDLKGLSSDSIVYCFGAGEDVSHDIEIATTLNSNVHIFDPTPRSREHLNLVYSVIDDTSNVVMDNKIGGGDLSYWDYVLKTNIKKEQLKFYSYGVGSKSGLRKFYLPENLDHVSHSLISKDQNSSFIEVEIKDLTTIMQELGHTTLDLLKMDIEGSEFSVILDLLKNKIFPKYIAVEFHPNKTEEDFNLTIGSLLSKGYSLLHKQNNDYTFSLNN